MFLLTPDIGLVFWMLVVFGIIVFILGKWGWPVITNMVHERNAYIENSINAAKEANQKLENVKADAEKLLADARSEKVQILHEASNMKEQIISEAKKQAETEVAKITENAKNNIQTEKENALKEIKLQVVQLTVQLSEKILKKELADKKSQEDFINEQLDEINALNK